MNRTRLLAAVSVVLASSPCFGQFGAPAVWGVAWAAWADKAWRPGR